MASKQDIPNLSGYIFGEKLGAGSYGTVYKAKLVSNSPSRSIYYAIKCIHRKSLTKTTQDLLINEIKLLKQVKHDNIVEMHDFQWDENYIYIVMEYCAGGDMSTFIGSRERLSEARARPFVQQIARALKFLYEKRISHMDLKPENILLTSGHRPTLKIADFGVAQHIGRHGSRSIRGTLLYMAPEILSSRPYDNRVDLWSIGIILYECVLGRSPFIFSTVDELIEQIKSNIPIDIPNDIRISSECRHLLEGLLQRDPNRRISFRDFFQHSFIQIDISFQLSRADDRWQRSINAEQAGDLKKAWNYRVRALDEYIAIIKIDENEDRKQTLRMKIKQGIADVERLKRQTNVSATTMPISPDNFDPQNDKELTEAYQHCLNGNHLMSMLRFAQASEEYQIGLSVMLRVARNPSIETDATKSKILRDVISFYLNKAEQCKAKNDNQQLELDMEKIKQDSILDEKHQSNSQQNCCLQ